MLIDLDHSSTFAARDRTYDPSTGTWTGTDPVTAPVGMPAASTYQYAFGSPAQYVDPTGDWSWAWNCALGDTLCDIAQFAAGEGRGAVDLIVGTVESANPASLIQANATCYGSFGTYGLDLLSVAATCNEALNPFLGLTKGFHDTYVLSNKGCYFTSGRAFFPAMAQTVAMADGVAGLRSKTPPPSAPRPPPELPPGYPSFTAAKKALGSPGEGNVFDHVVEQSQQKRSGFPVEDINSPFNMNPVPAAANQAKANYYSSIRPFTGGKTVRDWLTGQEFSDQYKFGADINARIQRGDELP
jgi:RHS repeat-associated protein